MPVVLSAGENEEKKEREKKEKEKVVARVYRASSEEREGFNLSARH